MLSGLCGLQNGQAVPRYVAEHPAAVWLVGPFFAAVTGLAFKEVSLSPLCTPLLALLIAYEVHKEKSGVCSSQAGGTIKSCFISLRFYMWVLVTATV